MNRLLLFTFALLCLAMASLPAAAGNVYDNGPVNGQVDSFLINFGNSVTDSFTVSNGNGNIGGLSFDVWLLPGDTVTAVEVQLGSTPFGDDLFDNTVGMSQSNCFMNPFGFNVCQETGSFTGPNLGNGNYWLTLQNATVSSGDPTFWDQNSGVGCQSPGCPSQAQNLGVGSIPSETFTLIAQATTTGTTPEPSSLLLLASGCLGMAGILRRKFF